MKNYKKIISLIAVIALTLSILSGCSVDEHFKFAMDTRDTTIEDITDGSHINKYSISKSPQSVNTAKPIVPSDFVSLVAPEIVPLEKKARTIMIYMNGSDLESKYQSATDDIQEMFDSGFDSENINLLIFTGGTTRWYTKGIPANINAVFKLDPEGGLIKLAEVGTSSTGNPEVLAGFINLCYKFFPAENYGLIFWNHGGGAVVGYGADERYEKNPDRAMMRLSEIDSAFASTNLIADNQIFEFVGFDTCLMSTLEMACITGKYSSYMIASEELEPGPGWDYYFLGEIVPDMSGYEIGEIIIEYYADFYEYSDEKEIITLSMVDLSKIQDVADAFENMAAAAGNALASGQYNTISKARSKSRMFGSYEEHGGGSDMIDVSHLAESLLVLLPEEAGALLDALEEAVVYKYENNVEELGGLSIYFPFTNKYDMDYYISIYRTMNQLPNYTSFIEEFSNALMSAPIGNYRNISSVMPERQQSGECTVELTPQELENLAEVYLTVWEEISPEQSGDNSAKSYIQVGKSSNADIQSDGTVIIDFDRTWTELNGKRVCMYELSRNNGRVRYAIPARFNGEDADLIAVCNDEHPNGKIIGAVPTGKDGVYNALNKKMIKIRDGDVIEILYCSTEDLYDKNAGNLWYSSSSFTVDGELELNKTTGKGEYLYGITLVDTQKNEHNTAFGILEDSE